MEYIGGEAKGFSIDAFVQTCAKKIVERWGDSTCPGARGGAAPPGEDELSEGAKQMKKRIEKLKKQQQLEDEEKLLAAKKK